VTRNKARLVAKG
jgi:hypothetical protein